MASRDSVLADLGLIAPPELCELHAAPVSRVRLDGPVPQQFCSAVDCSGGRTTTALSMREILPFSVAVKARILILCNDTSPWGFRSVGLPPAGPADPVLLARAAACDGRELAEDQLRERMRVTIAQVDAAPGHFAAARSRAQQFYEVELAAAAASHEQAVAEARYRERIAQLDAAEAAQISLFEADLTALDGLAATAAADFAALRAAAAVLTPVDLAALAPALISRAEAVLLAASELERAGGGGADVPSPAAGLTGAAAVAALVTAADLGGGLARIRELSLAGARLTAPDLRALAASEALSAITTPWLRSLDLDDNPGLGHAPGDGDEAAAALSAIVAALPQLAALHARDCGLGPSGMGILAAALRTAPCLRSLGLSGARLGPQGASELAAALTAGALPELETLMLSGNDLCSGAAAGAAALFGALPRTLAELHLGGNRMGVADAAALARSAPLAPLASPPAAPPSLRYLDLGGCTLRPAGCAALTAALSSSAAPPALRVLVLSRNELGDGGAGSLAAALPRLGRLERLQVAGNCIGADAAAALAEALAASCPALEQLDLSRNFIGPQGFGQPLLGPLGRLPSLRRLEVAGNGDQGLMLKEMIRRGAFPALAFVDVPTNGALDGRGAM